MPAIVKRIFFLSLALILSLTLIGCAGGGLSQEEIDQIVANAVTAAAEIDSGKFDLDMSLTMNVVGGDQPGEGTAVIDTTGAADNLDKEMQMTMNMVTDTPDQGRQEWTMEIYGTGGWMYMKMAIPGQDEQWRKIELTEEVWQQQGQLGQEEIELLTTATKVKYLGSEVVNGTDCYVVEITPSIETLGNLMSQQLQFLAIPLEQFNLPDILKEMSAKEWIAKDSYLLMRAEVYMAIEIRTEDVEGATEADFEKITMDTNMGLIFYDYNQPVSIELPPEALEAEEVTD